MKERITGGPLTRKIHRAAAINNREDLTKLLHGDRPRTVDAQGNSVTETPMSPAKRIAEVIADAEAYLEYCDRQKLGADLHSPAWFASEISWRLKRGLAHADEFTTYTLLLAFEAGRLSKEAQIVVDGLDAKTPATVAREEASEHGLREARRERTAANAERDARIIERAKDLRAKFPSFVRYRVAKILAPEFGLSIKQIERIIALLFD